MRNRNWKTDKPTGVLLALIRKALWGEEFAWTEEIDWEKVFSLALKHGVAAVVYETVKALPKGQRPPFEILLRWDVTAEMVRQGYRKRHAALLHLRDILAPKGIKIVVLKGESLAINYPDPECRECGDVDIFTPGDYDKTNRLIQALGYKVDYHYDFHSTFVLDGTLIENHNPFPDKKHFEFTIRANEIVQKEIGESVLKNEEIYHLPISAALIFEISHIARDIRHKKLTFRNLIDLALLYHAKRAEIDERKMMEDLRYVGLERLASNLFAAINNLFGIPVPSTFETKADADKFLDLMLVGFEYSVIKKIASEIYRFEIIPSTRKDFKRRFNDSFRYVCAEILHSSKIIEYLYSKIHKR